MKTDGRWLLTRSWHLWVWATGLIASVGCQFARPLDHDVSVTQQPSLEEVATQPTKTRLNARRAEKENTAEAVNVDEVMDAFSDSPANVRQQALRQLQALTSSPAGKNKSDATHTLANHSATKAVARQENRRQTKSPEGIVDSLRALSDELPTLADDLPESDTLPMRIAAKPPQTTTNEAIAKADRTVREPNRDTLELPQDESKSATTTPPAKAKSPAPAVTLASAEASQENVPAEPIPTSPVEPIEGPKSYSDADLYRQLIARLQTPLQGESDADRCRRLMIARHLSLFSGDPDAAVAPIEGVASREQEFLRHQMLGLWAIVDEDAHPVVSRRLAAALPEWRIAVQNLAASTPELSVRSLAFCKEIQSFGQVTPFETSRFTAGQKVILYCEVDDFVAEKTAAGYETHLQGSYEVFDAKNQKVAGQVLPADKQVCANYLRDYFIAYQMNLPAGLTSGEYRLELSMECLQGRKYGQASIPFVIAAK